MGLDGIAGRQMLGRLAVPRERKRAADNDNVVPPEVGAGRSGAGESARGAHAASASKRVDSSPHVDQPGRD
jgi:hypothetical protein